MNKYENESIGTIIIVKNIIFPDTKTNKKILDHSWSTGRPCLIIYSDDEYDYILPITSKARELYKDHYFLLSDADILYRYSVTHEYNANIKQNQVTHGSVHLTNIYKIPITGHNERGKVSLTTLKSIITKLKAYHKVENIDTIIKNAKTIGGR